jgi:hypothetical protein
VLRLVVNKVATLQEIEVHWSLTDMMDVDEAFDLQSQADTEAIQK